MRGDSGTNFSPVITMQTLRFRYLASGCCNWFCIDTDSEETLWPTAVGSGRFLWYCV